MSENNNDSNPSSIDPNVDKSTIDIICSRQDKQFSILTETLRKTLNEFGQNLGTHLHKVLDMRLKEKESVHEITMPGSSSYPPEDPDGNRREEEESLGPEDHEWNRPSEGEMDAPSKTEPEDPKGKRPVKRRRPGEESCSSKNKKSRDFDEKRHSPVYEHDSDTISLHPKESSDDDTQSESNSDEMHSIIHKAAKIHARKEEARKHEVETLFGDLMDGEQRGVAVESTLANALEKVWNKSQPTEKVKRLTDKQLVPENCPFLQVPRVNNEIFSVLSQQAKGHDVKLQKHEMFLAKAAVPLANMINELMKIKIDQPMSEALLVSLKQSASDAFALLGAADSNLLQTRRDDIVPSLSGEYRQLRLNVEKGSPYLFGENIDDRIRIIKKSSLTSHTITSKQGYSGAKRRDDRYKPYSKNQRYFPKRQQRVPGKKPYRGRQNNLT